MAAPSRTIVGCRHVLCTPPSEFIRSSLYSWFSLCLIFFFLFMLLFVVLWWEKGERLIALKWGERDYFEIKKRKDANCCYFVQLEIFPLSPPLGFTRALDEWQVATGATWPHLRRWQEIRFYAYIFLFLIVYLWSSLWLVIP